MLDAATRAVDLFAPDLMSERRKRAVPGAVAAIGSTSFCHGVLG
jgi:hypothetical protein